MCMCIVYFPYRYTDQTDRNSWWQETLTCDFLVTPKWL